MKTLRTTPKQDGFRMPGEFEEHDGCFMIWPERTDNWRLGAKMAQKTFAEVAKAINEFEPLTMIVSEEQYLNARSMLDESIRVVEMANNDSWVRDCGPSFVTDGETIRGVDWEFNAWGGLSDGLYFPWDKDDQIAQKICDLERVDRYRTDGFVLEGGSIHVDGEGTCLVTEECLLNKGRNPHLNKTQIEEMLKEYLNVSKIIWLEKGIYNDETNGHIDNICCFVKPGEVLLAYTDDKNDPQFPISQAAFEFLSDQTDAKGRKLKIHKMISPKPILISEIESQGVDEVNGTHPRKCGDRLAASYVNFYIANGGVIFPEFGDENDKKAKQILQKLFPDRKIVGVYTKEILLGGGNIHCITQQLPKAKK